MKTKILLIFLLELALYRVIFGQTKTPDFPYIEVTGNAELSVVPDEITIAIKIKERFKNKEKVTIKQQEDSLKYYIAKEDLDLNNLSLSNSNSDYVQISWSRKATLTETNYLFKASDAVQVAKIFQIAEKFMLYDASIVKINHSKLEDFKNEVRIKAIKNAKDKADQMLTAIGFQAGRPWIVEETSPDSRITRTEWSQMACKDVNSVCATGAGIYQSDSFNNSFQWNSKPDVPEDPYSIIASRHNLSFSKIKIVSSVYVKYEIK